MDVKQVFGVSLLSSLHLRDVRYHADEAKNDVFRIPDLLSGRFSKIYHLGNPSFGRRRAVDETHPSGCLFVERSPIPLQRAANVEAYNHTFAETRHVEA